MSLDPYYRDRLSLFDGFSNADRAAAGGTLDEAFQERLAAYGDDGPWNPPSDVVITDEVVDGPHGAVPIRHYVPADPSGVALLWVHGGGFAAGTLDWPEAHVVSAELAARAGAEVVSVDYRLADGTTRYPVPLDDVLAVWEQLDDERSAVPGARTAVGGASAGAALALAASLRSDRRADAVLLAYPFLHAAVPALPADVLAEMAVLPDFMRFPTESIDWMVENYVGRLEDVPELALPGIVPVTPDRPPLSVLLSEFDDLRPSGELLIAASEAAGAPVRSRLEPGVLHGHLNRHPVAPGVSPSLDWLADGLRAMGNHAG
ncbi:alpha/beta hydrolase fold domain-containing protein [Plantibacter sp. VKM Ac-2876]|uniref:alpha/beta hydrolase fold domain-containing protein n=1 Tax=Plantibacter sp. VKM Ac-2876 TaxID=2783826 RepID=UPI00188D1CAA|nr:alpha/beta hydrolase [Plantibacter sp. VKM Ac-2876]MBF4566658.1 alpha/beta hydrolase [Plantibacter sp. VKM Ac-2876]